MSVALSSWESLLELVKRYHNALLPPYYSKNHMTVLLDMIGLVLGQRTYQVVVTKVPLIEPIVTLKKTILVSRPLVAYCVNQPIKMPVSKIKLVTNVDILGDLLPLVNASEDDDNDDSGNKGNGEQSVVTPCERQQQRGIAAVFSKLETIQIQHLLRLALMVSHWDRHRRHKIPYNRHADYPNLEMASDVQRFVE